MPSPGGIVRFGIFQLNLQTGELHRSGVPVKLHGQPIQILTILLERPGVLVTRDELREQLWPGHTFIDFEHSLNSAVKRLREALSDSADGVIVVTPTVQQYPALVIAPAPGALISPSLGPAPDACSR